MLGWCISQFCIWRYKYATLHLGVPQGYMMGSASQYVTPGPRGISRRHGSGPSQIIVSGSEVGEGGAVLRPDCQHGPGAFINRLTPSSPLWPTPVVRFGSPILVPENREKTSFSELPYQQSGATLLYCIGFSTKVLTSRNRMKLSSLYTKQSCTYNFS